MSSGICTQVTVILKVGQSLPFPTLHLYLYFCLSVKMTVMSACILEEGAAVVRVFSQAFFFFLGMLTDFTVVLQLRQSVNLFSQNMAYTIVLRHNLTINVF